MQLSENGVWFIKTNEGFKPKVYNDNGKPAIGYGHDLQEGESFPDGITEPQAETVLLKDAALLYPVIARFLPQATQNQFDALVDFGYNLGIEDLEKLLRHGPAALPAQMPLWCYERNAQGVEVKNPVLAARRAAEVAMLSEKQPVNSGQ